MPVNDTYNKYQVVLGGKKYCFKKINKIIMIFFFFFAMPYGQGSNPCPVLGAWSLHHWTAREVPIIMNFIMKNEQEL